MRILSVIEMGDVVGMRIDVKSAGTEYVGVIMW
jgi:hypothetical protein